VIAPLPLPVSDRDLAEVAALLVDAVDGGASTSFLPPLSVERATAWWLGALAEPTLTLVARDDAGICGCVQLCPAWAPNQPHRADIAKLLVHRRARRRGLGRALMHEIEARAAGRFTLLTLDTRRGDDADRLYRALGWTVAGVIPDYAIDRDGVPHDSVFFYKTLRAPA
jgi:ribosomal protein S18 acetylase RimI-like enzyme